MADSPSQLSELLADVYQGALESPPWGDLLGRLRRELALGAAILYLRKPQAWDPGTMVADGLELGAAGNIYASDFYLQDPFVNLPPGEVHILAEHTALENLCQSDFYLRCMQPYGVHHILGADLPTEDGGVANLRLTRPQEGEGFGEAERQYLTLLIPHLQRAILIYGRIGQIESERALYADTLNQLALATALLDAECTVVKANPVARLLFDSQQGIACRQGKLRLQDKAADAQFRQLVAETVTAMGEDHPAVPRSMAVPRGSGTPLGLVVRPAGQAAATNPKPQVAVFISDPERPNRAPRAALSELFGLTPAEAGLAIALANGLPLEQASQQLGISRNTGRAHLRSIFSKTGVSQQTMLVRLVLQSVANLG